MYVIIDIYICVYNVYTYIYVHLSVHWCTLCILNTACGTNMMRSDSRLVLWHRRLPAETIKNKFYKIRRKKYLNDLNSYKTFRNCFLYWCVYIQTYYKTLAMYFVGSDPDAVKNRPPHQSPVPSIFFFLNLNCALVKIFCNLIFCSKLYN